MRPAVSQSLKPPRRRWSRVRDPSPLTRLLLRREPTGQRDNEPRLYITRPRRRQRRRQPTDHSGVPLSSDADAVLDVSMRVLVGGGREGGGSSRRAI